MLDDIVVDTNVFLHADDPRQENRQQEAIEFLNRLVEVSTSIAVDEGFDVDESKNRSQIGYEYLTNLTAVSLGMRVIVALVSGDRVETKSRSLNVAAKKRINQLIRKKSDRAFLAVACNSNSKILCSHDFEDFQKPKRKTIRKDLGVTICEAEDAIQLLDDDPAPVAD
jgi:predicted nucleic acid-binding protein